MLATKLSALIEQFFTINNYVLKPKQRWSSATFPLYQTLSVITLGRSLLQDCKTGGSFFTALKNSAYMGHLAFPCRHGEFLDLFFCPPTHPLYRDISVCLTWRTLTPPGKLEEDESAHTASNVGRKKKRIIQN